MSTKSSVILTEDNEHIYFDCSNEFKSDGQISDELTIEISKKNCRVDINDNEDLVFTLNKDSQIYRYFVRAIAAERKQAFQSKTKDKACSSYQPSKA